MSRSNVTLRIDVSDASRRITKTLPGNVEPCPACLDPYYTGRHDGETRRAYLWAWATEPRFGHVHLFGIYVAVTAVIEAVKWAAS